MCETGDDIGEFIVYELTKEEIDEEDQEEFQDTEVIEMAEEEEEEEAANDEAEHYVLGSTTIVRRIAPVVKKQEQHDIEVNDDIEDENSQLVELQLQDIDHKYAAVDAEDEQRLEDEYQTLEDTCDDEDELMGEATYVEEEEVDAEDEIRLEEEEEEEHVLEQELETMEAKVPRLQSTGSDARLTAAKGPKRYLLFDDLIATIVDYDSDGTPIVEFSMSGCDADEKLPVECGICPDVMHKSKLAKHLKTHVAPGTNRYACIYCDETYKDYKYLAGHSRRHMGIRPYVCEPCKLYFSTKQDLRVHNQRRHQVKEHICEICGKTFAQNTQLKRHRESTHEKKRRFACHSCPKAYYKNFALQEHIRAVHEGNRRMLVCPFCGMQCRDAHKMARHRKDLHLNQSNYKCHICQEEFTDISYFDAHKRSIQCRNNTRRKLEEEEEEQVQQQMEEHVVYEITLDNEPTN